MSRPYRSRAAPTTLYGLPGAPSFSTVSPVYLSTDSLIVQWTAGGNGGSPQYQAEISSDPSGNFSYYFSSITANTNAAFGEAGLAAFLKPNTTYYARVKIYNSGGAYNPAVASASTFAVPPDVPAFINVSSNIVTVTWIASRDGPVLKYQAVISTNVGFAPAMSTTSWQAGQSATFSSGISPNTQYWVAVRALGNNGDTTGFTPAVSTFTISVPPPGLAGTVLGISSITWTWAAVASSYNFYPSTGGPAINLNTASLTQTGLSINTLYGARVSAIGADGESAKSALVSKYTFAVTPTGLGVVFSDTWFTSATIRAGWNPGADPFGTAFLLQGSTNALAAFSPVTASSQTFNSNFAELSAGLILGATYYLRVQALNGDGIPTAFAVGASTYVAPLPQLVMNFTPGQQSSGTFSQAVGPVTLTVPASAFTVPVTITIKRPTNPPPCADVSATTPGLTPTSIMAEFDIAEGIEPRTNVFLSMGYGGGAGLPAGTDPARLVVARCDTARNEWEPLYSSVSGQTVNAVTPHLSIFQVMAQSPATDISAVMVSNNPFRPSQGQTTMDFAHAPAGVRLRIYTVRGELVKDLSTNVSGMASWDGTNRSGRGVASGGYFVLIQGAGQEKTIPVVVER